MTEMSVFFFYWIMNQSTKGRNWENKLDHLKYAYDTAILSNKFNQMQVKIEDNRKNQLYLIYMFMSS